jgi:hypothetical protein
MAKSKILPGRFKFSEREEAPFVGYWRWSAHAALDPAFAKLRAAYDQAINSADAFKVFVDAHHMAGKLSKKGIAEEAIKYLRESGLPNVTKRRFNALAPVRRDIEARLAQMKPVEVDTTDMVGEMQRREIRDALRSMPEDKAIRLVERGEDEALIDAVLSAPPLLTGLPEGVRRMAIERRLDQRHGPERRALAELVAAAETVDRAYEAARDEMRVTAGMTLHDFKELTKAVEGPIRTELEAAFAKEPANPDPLQNVDEVAAAVVDAPDDDGMDGLGQRLAQAAE